MRSPVCAIALAAVVAACDVSSPSAAPPVANVTDSRVLGSWRTACTSTDGMTSTRATNVFTADGRIDIVTTAYLDPNCVLHSFDLVRSGTYLEHTEAPLPEGGARVSLDQVFDQNSVRPRGPGSADVFNAMAACGFTNWETDVALDIGNCINDPGVPFIGIEVPFATYTIVREDRGRLFFGDETSFTRWNRPTAFGDRVALVRESGADGDAFPERLIGLWRDPARLFEGGVVSMGYVLVGTGGRLTFIDLIPQAQCLGDVTFSLFETGEADRYREAFERFVFTLTAEGDELRVSLDGVDQVTAFERETDVLVDDLPLCRPLEGPAAVR